MRNHVEVKLVIDTDARTLQRGDTDQVQLFSPEAFRVLSELWIQLGWELKYPYLFSWMGRPVIQLPDDLVVVQEVVYRVKPDVIIETGVAHGGSLVFYASLFEAMGHGHVIGVDLEIRPHNRAAIEAHELFHRITLVEGSSTDPDIVEMVRAEIGPEESVLVVLDSNHTRAHVHEELEIYSAFVTPGSYIVATDGVMELLVDVPRGSASWRDDNPKQATLEFAREHAEFELEDPVPPVFDEGCGIERVTHWPGAYLRRR